jgi:hypothetical protein
MSALAEPLSPELVLVAEDLRADAIAALPALAWQLVTPVDSPSLPLGDASQDDVPPAVWSSRASVAVQVLLYAAWHTVIGFFMGLGVFATVVLCLLALRLFA